MDLEAYLRDRRRLIEGALDEALPAAEDIPCRVHEAMRYSVFAGGKRLRPILCVASLEAVGKDPAPFMPAACALELVHTYSLIHDDLPAMDDDDLRRGKPTCHRVFGEAIAILAGDALLTLAFESIASMETASPSVRVELVRRLAAGIGTAGMVGGQVLDVSAEGCEVSGEILERIHAWKTAALIETSALFGAILGGAPPDRRAAISVYGKSLGMAFQITDDILDATGDEKRVGKRTRKDDKARKATYPARYGVEGALAAARRHVDDAMLALGPFDYRADPLREIARSLLDRER